MPVSLKKTILPVLPHENDSPDAEVLTPVQSSPSPVDALVELTNILITKVEALDNLTDKTKIIGKFRGAAELLSKNI